MLGGVLFFQSKLNFRPAQIASYYVYLSLDIEGRLKGCDLNCEVMMMMMSDDEVIDFWSFDFPETYIYIL